MLNFMRVAGLTATALVLTGPYGYAQDDTSAPKPPPVRPVTPGTAVDDQVAPVRLDEATMLAIREIVRQSVAQAVPSTAQTPTPQGYRDPAPSPQMVANAPIYQQAPVYQAPVTPVTILREKPWHKRALGNFGAKLASLGTPTITQGVIQQSYQTVQVVSQVSQQAVAVPQSVQPIQYTVTPQPQVQVPMLAPSPQAPRK